MRKIFSGFSLMMAAISAVAGNPAQMIRFNDNSSVAIQASTGNINRLFVKGDKITQHVAPQGTFILIKGKVVMAHCILSPFIQVRLFPSSLRRKMGITFQR